MVLESKEWNDGPQSLPELSKYLSQTLVRSIDHSHLDILDGATTEEIRNTANQAHALLKSNPHGNRPNLPTTLRMLGVNCVNSDGDVPRITIRYRDIIYQEAMDSTNRAGILTRLSEPSSYNTPKAQELSRSIQEAIVTEDFDGRSIAGVVQSQDTPDAVALLDTLSSRQCIAYIDNKGYIQVIEATGRRSCGFVIVKGENSKRIKTLAKMNISIWSDGAKKVRDEVDDELEQEIGQPIPADTTSSWSDRFRNGFGKLLGWLDRVEQDPESPFHPPQANFNRDDFDYEN